MRLNQVVEITRGELVNSPTIAEFEGISTDVNRLKKGWLYIASSNNQTAIKHALSKDIYGVILSEDLCSKFSESSKIQNLDSENSESNKIQAQGLDSENSLFADCDIADIAIIKTRNVLECVSRLVRYMIFQKEIKLYALNDAEYAIARAIVRSSRAIVSNDIVEIFENFCEQTNFIFSSSREVLSLSFDQNSLQTPLNEPFSIISYALFDMRISYKNKEYLLNLPYLFLDEFSALLSLCEQENLTFELDKFDHLKILKPNFIDSDGNLLEYGQGQKVIVAQSDNNAFRSCARYFNKYAKWAIRCFVVPNGLDSSAQDFVASNAMTAGSNKNASTKFLEYKNDDDLYKLILREHYNFMVILGLDDEQLIRLLQTKKHPRFSQGTLF